MSIDVVVPNLPESVADATLINWHKQPGDIVAKNEHLVDLETDKVVLEVTAPESGILSRIVKENGSIVLSGEVLAVLEPQAIAAQAVSIDHTTEQQEPSEPVLSPSVRRLIHEHGLDPTLINGSGKDGRLTKADVLGATKWQVLLR